jgi:hypothetical protein
LWRFVPRFSARRKSEQSGDEERKNRPLSVMGFSLHRVIWAGGMRKLRHSLHQSGSLRLRQLPPSAALPLKRAAEPSSSSMRNS